MPAINHLKKFPIPSLFSNSQILQGTIGSNGKYFSKDIVKNDTTKEKHQIPIQVVKEELDATENEYKFSPYLKPLNIRGIKRANRYIDYNTSYNFIKEQKDFKENELKTNLIMKILYDGSKVPLPPKKYKMSQYVDTRLDLISPFILAGLISLPFFFATNM